MAVPKTRRSRTRKRSRQQHVRSYEVPELTVLPNGRRVPANMVTPENPLKKGVKFLPSKPKKAKKAA